MSDRHFLADLRPPAPPAALKARVLGAVSSARSQTSIPCHWLDSTADDPRLRLAWQLAMLAALAAHLWVGSAARDSAIRFRLLPEVVAMDSPVAKPEVEKDFP